MVVIAILLVRHRDPRGARRDGADGGGSIPGESASLLGGSRHGGSRDVEAGESAADALVKTSNANLRALFGGVGGGESNVGRSIFATPSETDAESAAETETSLRKGPGPNVAGFETGKDGNPGFANATGAWSNGEWSNGGLLADAWNRARAALASAERFSSSRVSALRASVQRTRRMVAAAAEGDDDALVAAPPRDAPAARRRRRRFDPRRARRRAATRRRPCWTSPARFRRWPARSRRRRCADRGGRRQKSLSTLSRTGSRTQSFRRVRRWAVFRPPPSPTRCRRPGRPSIALASPPGRAVRLRRLRPSPRRRGGASSKRRRRARTRARLRRHRRRTSPPSPRAAGVSSGRRTAERAVMGAGRAVAPEQAGRPAMVKSTTRFL